MLHLDRALPIYLAALSPAMLRLAGEVADGVELWLCNPSYIRDVVIPEVSAGRQRAGLTLEGCSPSVGPISKSDVEATLDAAIGS